MDFTAHFINKKKITSATSDEVKTDFDKWYQQMCSMKHNMIQKQKEVKIWPRKLNGTGKPGQNYTN